jgi:hypothetical protein
VHDVFDNGIIVATYPLDGNANDLGGAYNGTATGVVYEAGKFGQAARFSTSATITSDIPASIVSGSFSVSLWGKDTELFQLQRAPWYIGTDGAGKSFCAYHTLENRLGLDLYGSQTYETGDLGEPTGKMIHIVYNIYNTSSANWYGEIYVDGVLKPLTQTRSSTTVPNITTNKFGLNGYSEIPSGRTNFLLDQVRVCNRALNSIEVQTLYNEKYLQIEPTVEFKNSVIVDKFTKLGSDAPAIKMKKLTGTTANVQGGAVTVAHGLTATKILSISVRVHHPSGESVPPEYSNAGGYQFSFYNNSVNVAVLNSASNSASILSKPFTVLITYEE